MNIWVVSKYNVQTKIWEFCGVFDSKEKAEAVCLSRFFMVGPAELNRDYTASQEIWPGHYFPKTNLREGL